MRRMRRKWWLVLAALAAVLAWWCSRSPRVILVRLERDRAVFLIENRSWISVLYFQDGMPAIRATLPGLSKVELPTGAGYSVPSRAFSPTRLPAFAKAEFHTSIQTYHIDRFSSFQIGVEILHLPPPLLSSLPSSLKSWLPASLLASRSQTIWSEVVTP